MSDIAKPANLSRSTVLMVINDLSGAKAPDQTRIVDIITPERR